MLTKRTLLAIFCSLIFPICPLLYGQASGSLSGTVSDKTGSVVTGAKVTITSQSTGVARDAKTDDTRKRRVAQAIDWIAEGKSRNWKYER